jgi:hypothetical protein
MPADKCNGKYFIATLVKFVFVFIILLCTLA